MAVHTLRGLCPNCLALFAFAPAESGGEAAATVRMDGPAQALSATLRYIGDYELQEEIGRGGMGVVFRARQAGLNRTVAVKMIIAGEYAGPDERLRFQREAEAAAQLRHPNIVAIHEVGEHEGRSYFSMDFIEGKTLSSLLKEEKLPPARAAALVKTLAGAVHFAHQRGTLHRDLKPQNILISPDGQPHILDFGLARPVEREAGLTRTGDVMGSPSYMPPEQATGRIGDIGPASDVYALGTILYEAITGSPPFTGETAVEVLTQVIDSDPVPPRKKNPNVPADLETICLKCLEKRPERRYHSARALAEELERFLNFEPITAKPASRLRKTWSWTQRNPWVFAAGLGFVALVLVCVAYGLWEQTQVLHWRLEAGKRPAPQLKETDFNFSPAPLPTETGGQVLQVRGESPSMWFFRILPAATILLYFASLGFQRGYRRQVQNGVPVPERTLLLHGVAGLSAAVLGMGYLLLQTRWWMWHPPVKFYLPLEVAGVLCGLMLNGMGCWMVWEAVGIHETSRYQDLVNRILGQQLSRETRRWPVLKRIGFVLRLLSVLAAFIFMALLGWVVVGLSSDHDSWPAQLPSTVGVILSTILTLVAARAIRKRRRLSTFVGVPLALAAFVFGFVWMTANHDRVACFFFLCLFAAIQTVLELPLFKLPPDRRGGPATARWADFVVGAAFIAGLFALFHLVENWRGKKAWETCKHNLEAKGAKLDWQAYVPPPISDDQNIFKAPKMQEWFVGRGSNAFSAALDASAPWSPSNLPGPDVTVALVTLAGPGRGPAGQGTDLRYDDPGARKQAGQLISNAVGPLLMTPLNYVVTRLTTNQIQPAKIVLQCDRNLSAGEMESFFSSWDAANFLQTGTWFQFVRLLVNPDEPGRFRVTVRGLCPASEVVAWNKKLETQLGAVRQALQRPLARMEGNYADPAQIPVPNYVALRSLSQMLGASAQAYLLQNDPDRALTQLTLMHGLRHLMEGPPGGRPETLVAAMINIAISGLYVNTIQDGLRLQVWRDSQLDALEGQLKEIELPTYVERSLEWEQATGPKWLDMMQASHSVPWLTGSEAEKWDWNRVILHLIPDGWLDQNKVTYVEAFPELIEAFDLPHHTMLPGKFEKVNELTDFNQRTNFLPYTYFRTIGVPNFVGAGQTTALNQTLVFQARIACALERFRLDHREYPQSLAILVPQYLDQIPHDTIGGQVPVYRRSENGGFELSSAGWEAKKRWNWPLE